MVRTAQSQPKHHGGVIRRDRRHNTFNLANRIHGVTNSSLGQLHAVSPLSRSARGAGGTPAEVCRGAPVPVLRHKELLALESKHILLWLRYYA